MGFLKFLIEHGSWINHRARGTFFLPVDQQELHKQDQMCSHETDYCGDKYYGEYPLSFAASLGNKEMYSYLLSKGSDPDAKDSFGNTALHMMVIHQQPDMYVYSMSSVSSVKPKEQSNGYNRTPQILAALTGAPKMFHVIVELKKECHWTYGKMECNSYDLTGIDSINSEQGDTDSQSALILTLNGTGHGHLEMLESTIIARVLEQKWNTFGKKMFATSLLLVLLYLLCLSVCIYTRRSGDLFAIQSGQDIVRLVFEALTVIEAACYTAYDLVRVLVKSGPVTAVKAWVRDAPMKLLFLCSCSLVSLVVIGRLTGCRALEDVCLSLVAVGSWSYLLFYCRGFRLVGPFVVMIYEMILVDVLRFVLIYVIFLIGFSQVFHFLLKDRAESFETAWGSAMTLFQMTLGSFKYSELKKGKHVILVHILFMVFMILAGVLLFNMLIAMMAGTYQNITHRSYMEWRRQWAKIIMVLESSLSSSQRLKYQNMYSIDMNSILQPSGRRARRIPALMVTKQRDETCIKYQSAAFNWKRAEALTKGLKVLRVLGKCESEILTRQAVASSQRKQTGALKTWTAPNGNTHD
ncbi:transient receptor potential cation channel subfamily V member 5-like isoform X2 [Corticium candelabrum]|nr:transient receptor potential cation channel subfamily V member 5-like isoform X2 [Corticium candelabrum]